MKLYRPKSFLLLLLLAFSFVALPLLAALVSSAYFMEKMAVQSTQAVFWSAGSAKESRLLLAQLVSQERQARLYDVFAEPANLIGVQKKHEEIQETLERLADFPFPAKEKNHISRIRIMENSLFHTITSDKRTKESKEALDQYNELHSLGQEIQAASHKLMVQEAEKLQVETSLYQHKMFWQTLILFFVSLLLISIFAYLLIRPIRQIDKGILRLGEGDFVTPVAVHGPRDLEFLGTKLDWLRERLAELEKEKNKFVAHISHELKTPLASIREGAGLLNEEVVGPLTSQQKAVIKILNNNSRLLQKLIENILNFNMAQARNLPSQKELFSLDSLISEVTEDHKPALLANNVTLHKKLVPTTMNGDRDQMHTVIDNLLSNALKHTPPDTEISITMEAASEKTVIDIIDSGPGVAEEDRTKIFRPFFQGKNAQKGRVKGTGLGLAIAREYVSHHQGALELIDDTNPGAHFRLTLPTEETS